MERPDGVAPSSHAGEPRSSDGRAALPFCWMIQAATASLNLAAGVEAAGQNPVRE